MLAILQALDRVNVILTCVNLMTSFAFATSNAVSSSGASTCLLDKTLNDIQNR